MARVLPRSSRPMASKTRAFAAAPPAHDLVAERVDLDQHHRELAMLARGQVDFAAQLVLEVASRVQPGCRIAQALVRQFQTQLLVGALLLLELFERGAQLGILLPLRRLVEPEAAQPA